MLSPGANWALMGKAGMNYTGPARPIAKRKRRYAPASVLMPRQIGYARTGGFYGRYGEGSRELKFFDTVTNFTYDATGEVPATGQLNLIPQGNTQSTRVGRKCTIRQIQVRWLNFTAQAAATAGDAGYIAIWHDRQCNGAAAAAGDVLITGNGIIGQSMRNLENSARFRCLKEWRWNLQPAAGVTTAWSVATKWIVATIKCNIPIEFDSTFSTGVIGTIRSNNIFLLAGSANQDDQTTCAGNVRVLFSDD